MTPLELRSRRVALSISVGELAFEARLPIKAVQEIENSNRDVPHPEVFMRVLERLEHGYVMRRDKDSADS
jgi:hypothetical protein